MSEIANPAPVAQRFIPANRESFFDAQRRNRRATWRLSALCALSAAIMGIPLALVVTPLIYAVILICADIVSFFRPLPPAFWTRADEVARFGMVAFNRVLNHQPADPQSLAIGAAVMLLPGALLSISLWLGMNGLLRNAGVGGALLALKAREPNPSDLKELRLSDVVQEMAIAAGIPAPRVMLIDAGGANAAALGTSPADARIVISRRLIDDLSRDELEGALAHLIASIGNGDLRIAFRVAAIFESCGLLVAMINSPFGSESRRTLWRLLRYGLVGSSNDAGAQEADAVADILSRSVLMGTDDLDRLLSPGRKSAFRSLLTFILFPIFMTNVTVKMSLWFFSFSILGPSVALLWRTRQYLADASAIQLTRNPDGLASALQKMSDDPGAIPGGDWASHLFIVAPGKASSAESAMPSPREQQILAQAWAASAQAPGAPASAAAAQPADFRAILPQVMALHRSAFMGDPQAAARIRALSQAAAAIDPAVASMIPDPADLVAARNGDRAAMARLAAITRQFKAHEQTQSPAPQRSGSEESSGLSSISSLSPHPSLKRRLKRLDRMGAHAEIAATDRKTWMVGAVIGLIFAPFFILIAAGLLLIIAIFTLTSLTFLVIWVAVLHKILTLIPHH
ncbi:MAG TPA: M48 family metalloprotease [Candidatus Limnocylindrales bacterium]|nr:M48 family metalloprotease [Candidatus Limnocylindrales bacterium]